MAYRIGIDIGSKTIKLVVIDEENEIVQHLYWRHRADVRATLIRMLSDFEMRFGNMKGTVAITGSAGIAVAEMLGLPFVQEVIATTRAVRECLPQADAIVELGGEDAKVIYLTGNLEQRMNATCAGGTGGFIDTIAFMLGVQTREMNHLAARSKHIYPIASRCAVFAQTDVRPLLNAGASKEDIAASALDAVVRQTIGGLACGRPLRGTIAFLGGPFEFIPELARRFSMTLELEEGCALRPRNAHLFTALGAAIIGGEEGERGGDPALRKTSTAGVAQVTGFISREASVSDAALHDASTSDAAPFEISISQLRRLVTDASLPEEDMERLPPLFANDQEREAFMERHGKEKMPRIPFSEAHGPFYLGFDAGSTTVKYALVDEDGALVASGYEPTEGDVLATATELLSSMYKLMPNGEDDRIGYSVAIGYGADLLKAAFGIDADVVETQAHLRGALAFRPDVSFVLDIGGQDMKAIWVEEGRIADAVLNEACSSGCGSFVEGTAHSLGRGPEQFASSALSAKAPIDLGTKCTVFMTSRVRHAQKAGASRADISAGIAYSVVQNALYRVIGRGKALDLGHCAVAQGGTFKSDAVLRAFELVSGIEVVRPDTAHLMGAIGAALIARDHARELREANAGEGSLAASTSDLVGPEKLAAINARYGSWRCTGCGNACMLSIVDLGDGRSFIAGNRCGRGEELGKEALAAGCVPLASGTGLTKNVASAGANPAGEPLAARSSSVKKPIKRVQPKHVTEAMGSSIYLDHRDKGPEGFHRDAIEQDIGWAAHSDNEMYRRWAELVAAKREESARLAQAKAEKSAAEQADSPSSVSEAAPASKALAESEKSVKSEGVGQSEECLRKAKPLTPSIPYRSTGLPLSEDKAAREHSPNVIAFEQRLLAGFNSQGEWGETDRRKRVGIIAGLDGYETLPFWNAFFRHLGFSITAAGTDATEAARAKAAESIPSESVCEPAKITHAQAYALRDAGAGVLFMPRYERGYHCAVSCGYASALAGSVPFLADGLVALASPFLHSFKPSKLASEPVDVAALTLMLSKLDPEVEWDEADVLEALDVANEAQGRFESEVRERTKKAIEWVEADPRRRGIVVAGRPYHIDPLLLHGIDGVLEELGFAAIPEMGLDSLDGAPRPKSLWRPARHLLRIAESVIAHPQLEMLMLQSFNCGYDAVTLEDVHERLTAADRTFTVLKIDEIVDTSHIRIRLRTMAEAIEQRAREEASHVDRTVHHSEKANEVKRTGKFVDLLADGIGVKDLEVARSSVPADICFTAAAVLAHAVGKAYGDDEEASTDPVQALRVPRVCRDCLIEALPSVLDRNGVPDVAIEWVDTWDLPLPEVALPDLSDPVRIGIVGNPLLCFDGYMNEGLLDLLTELGAEPVLPDPRMLMVEDVRYLPQLDSFAEAGVDAVLYLQSFACLKGHVQARGAMNEFACRYPAMPITVIDYDPESSALNRENRIRLAVESARRLRGSGTPSNS